MGKKTAPIKMRASISKRGLPDKKSSKFIPPKRGEPSDRSKSKSSAAKIIAGRGSNENAHIMKMLI